MQARQLLIKAVNSNNIDILSTVLDSKDITTADKLAVLQDEGLDKSIEIFKKIYFSAGTMVTPLIPTLFDKLINDSFWGESEKNRHVIALFLLQEGYNPLSATNIDKLFLSCLRSNWDDIAIYFLDMGYYPILSTTRETQYYFYLMHRNNIFKFLFDKIAKQYHLHSEQKKFCDLVRSGNVEAVREKLKENKSYYDVPVSGNTPLMIAIEIKNVSMFNLLRDCPHPYSQKYSFWEKEDFFIKLLIDYVFINKRPEYLSSLIGRPFCPDLWQHVIKPSCNVEDFKNYCTQLNLDFNDDVNGRNVIFYIIELLANFQNLTHVKAIFTEALSRTTKVNDFSLIQYWGKTHMMTPLHYSLYANKYLSPILINDSRVDVNASFEGSETPLDIFLMNHNSHYWDEIGFHLVQRNAIFTRKYECPIADPILMSIMLSAQINTLYHVKAVEEKSASLEEKRSTGLSLSLEPPSITTTTFFKRVIQKPKCVRELQEILLSQTLPFDQKHEQIQALQNEHPELREGKLNDICQTTLKVFPAPIRHSCCRIL